MPARPQIAALVRETAAALWPGRLAPDAVRDDAPLGGDGLGLDSIEIVELLLECEQRLGLEPPATEEPAARDGWLERGPITVGGLVDHLAAA